MKYIWQDKGWPSLSWRSESLLSLLGKARLDQGKLLAKVSELGVKLGREARAEVLVEEAVQTSAIEGEKLNRESVRSSVAKKLGLPSAGLAPSNRTTDGLVEVLLDATQNYRRPLTAARLKGWQAALFPSGHSGLSRIRVGKWRGPQPMQVVSGALGREKVHYEAPPSERVESEMKQFFSWWKASLGTEEGLLRAGIAHFHFVTIHPFEDGNGRLARALTDMALAQDEEIPTRYYSLSSQIMEERNQYYAVLEKCQKGSADITAWLEWFLGCHIRAMARASRLIAGVLEKADFWRRHAASPMNERQRKVVNRLLDAGRGGFVGGLTNRKYASLTKTSRATAYREITELLGLGVLRQSSAKGRSVSYELKW